MLSESKVKEIAENIKGAFPRAWSNCHKEGSPEIDDYIILVCKELVKLDGKVGCNGKRRTDELSHDAIWNDGRIVDIVASAGGSNPSITYNDVTAASTVDGVVMGKFIDPRGLRTYFDHNVRNIMIGCSMFPIMGMVKTELDRLKRNLEFFKEKFNGDYIRWFYTVGGDLFDDFDPWSEIGSFFNDPRHGEIFLKSLDLLKEFELKSHLVLVGSHSQANTEEKELAIVDRCGFYIRGRLSEFVLVEMRNEYLINGGTSTNCRNMARAFRARVGNSFPITLSSLDSVMGGNADISVVRAEYSKLYGGDSGANCLTIHNTRPEPIWNPLSLRERLELTEDIWDSEARGPGASAGGDVSNPEVFRTDLSNAKAGNAKGIVFHSRPGVWFGKCNSHWPGENNPANIYDIPGIENIASVYSGGVAMPPGETEMNPYPDEPTYWKDFEEKTAALYKKAGVDIPPQVFEAGRHMARTAYDLAIKMSPEESKEKHLNELAQALGVSR